LLFLSYNWLHFRQLFIDLKTSGKYLVYQTMVGMVVERLWLDR
jgi:hypothetical protein